MSRIEVFSTETGAAVAGHRQTSSVVVVTENIYVVLAQDVLLATEVSPPEAAIRRESGQGCSCPHGEGLRDLLPMPRPGEYSGGGTDSPALTLSVSFGGHGGVDVSLYKVH